MLNPAPLTVPQDTEKLKKHIALVCDRLGRGAKLTEGVSRRLFYLPLVVRLLEFPSWPKYLFTWLFVTVLRHCWLDDGKDIRPVKAGCWWWQLFDWSFARSCSSVITYSSVILSSNAPCRLRGCKNWPAPFPGRMSYKATKPDLVSVLYLSIHYMVLLFIRAPFYVLLVFIAMCAVLWLFC